MSMIRFGAVKSFTPAADGKPYATGVITHPITTFEGDKPVFTTGELPFRAYYPNDGFFRVDLPTRYGQQNGFSVGEDPQFGPGGSWNFTWSPADSVFEDMREIKRQFNAAFAHKPKIGDTELPQLDYQA